MSSRMVELATTIAQETARLEEHHSKQGLEPPSFEQHASTLSALPAHMQASRMHVIQATTELKELLMDPFELIMNHFDHPFWIYDIIRRFDLAPKIPLTGSTTYSDLASATGLPESTLRSILRYAMAYHIFAEKPPQQVSHTPASRLLATEPSVLEHSAFAFDEIIKPAVFSGEALQKWPNSTNPAETAFMLAEKSSAPNYWAHLSQDPPRLDRFVRIMAQGTARDADIISELYPWANAKKVVELGGSKGDLAMRLAERFPHLEIIVQDLPHVVGEANLDAAWRVKLMAHDFFEEQPVRDADVYLYRHCFHDWNDEACIRVLRALVPALKPGSCVLVVDAILPEPGAIPIPQERMLRSMDNNIRHVLGSKERDLNEWKHLFAKADTRFHFERGTMQPPGSQCGSIEVSWRP